MKPAKKKKEATPQFIMTNRGLMKCSLPEFEPSSYQGLKKNCGRKSKHETKPTTAETKLYLAQMKQALEKPTDILI